MKLSFSTLLPAVSWLSSYPRVDLRGDVAAGLTTAVTLIPQGMAYAMLAGLPPIVGLYASVIPLAVYALFGSSRQLAVGPAAMVSLLVIAGAGALARPGSSEFIALALALSLLVGLIQLAMGALRLGLLTNFLSHPVISGFTSAAALIIGASQLKHLLGVEIPRSQSIVAVAVAAARQLGAVQPTTLLLGAASIAALLLLSRYQPRAPRALVVVTAATLLVYLLGLDQRGVAIVGAVPSGFVRPTLPSFDLATLKALLPTALTIALVGFVESISVARALARRHRYEINADQELVALGLANIAGSFFSAYPVTGGFARSAINDQAGARSNLASLITAGFIALTLALLTPLFTYLPKAALAAIIIVSVLGLVDLAEVKHLYRVKRADLALLLLTFVATLSFGVERGILAGALASMLAFVYRTTRPHAAILGRLPGSEVYRSLENHPEAIPSPGLLVARIDAQFYYGNVSFLRETLRRYEAHVEGELRAVIIDGSSINQLDSSAAAALAALAGDYRQRGVALYLAALKRPVIDVLRRCELDRDRGIEITFLRVHDAVQAARGAHGPQNCPLA